MKSTMLVMALFGAGCTYDTSNDGDESPAETSAAVTVRAKTVSFEPLQLCEGWVRDAKAAELTCTNNLGNPCPSAVPRTGGAGGTSLNPMLGQLLPIWNGRFTPPTLYFESSDPKRWIDLNAETWVRHFSSISCHRATDPADVRVNYASGIPRGRPLLITETIFEHIRDVKVRGTVDIEFRGEGAEDGAIEVALQSANADGQWIDHAVTRSTFVGYVLYEVAPADPPLHPTEAPSPGELVGDHRQVLQVSATLPANETVLLRVRAGVGTVGKATGTVIHDIEFRGEECVPSNIPGECL